MNALNEIQNEAKVIVEQLADRQINKMKESYNQFLEWMSVDGNEVRSGYSNQVDTYQSAHKYIYMTQFKKYNQELGQYELPVAIVEDGVVTAINVLNGGSGYLAPPKINIIGQVS